MSELIVEHPTPSQKNRFAYIKKDGVIAEDIFWGRQYDNGEILVNNTTKLLQQLDNYAVKLDKIGKPCIFCGLIRLIPQELSAV